MTAQPFSGGPATAWDSVSLAANLKGISVTASVVASTGGNGSVQVDNSGPIGAVFSGATAVQSAPPRVTSC
jgi:hypothetical protein